MKLIALTIAALLFATGAAYADVVLIDYDAGNVGNGQLLNDITVGGVTYQQGALLNETLPGNIFHNTDGRSLAQYGGDGYNGGGVGDMTNTANIVDNAAVELNGFIAYRGNYSGGNNSFGFLENSTRLGATGNVPGNGDAFANSGEFFLFSDVYMQALTAADTVNISFQGGSDNGTATFDAYLLIDGATVGTQIGSTQTGNAAGSPRLTYAATGLTGSSLQLVIEAATGGNSRSLIDNIQFEIIQPIPEPGSFALLSLLGVAVGFKRRRR